MLMNLPNMLDKRDIFVERERKPQHAPASSGVTSSQAPASGASAHSSDSHRDTFGGFGSNTFGGSLSGSGGGLGLAGMASTYQQANQHQHQQMQYQQHQGHPHSQHGASSHNVSPTPSPHAPDDRDADDVNDARSDDDGDASEYPAVVIYIIDPFELAQRYFGGFTSDARRVAMLGLLKCFNELLRELAPDIKNHVSLQVRVTLTYVHVHVAVLVSCGLLFCRWFRSRACCRRTIAQRATDCAVSRCLSTRSVAASCSKPCPDAPSLASDRLLLQQTASVARRSVFVLAATCVYMYMYVYCVHVCHS